MDIFYRSFKKKKFRTSSSPQFLDEFFVFPVGFAVILMMDLKRGFLYIWDPIAIHFLILIYK